LADDHSCGLRNGASYLGPLAVDGPAYKALKEWASSQTTSLHGGDIVQEIATGRQGKIDGINSEIMQGRETQKNWRVVFSDAKEPPLWTFTNRAELRLVMCPHNDSEPGFYPSEGVM
jgi:hypothetical protein